MGNNQTEQIKKRTASTASTPKRAAVTTNAVQVDTFPNKTAKTSIGNVKKSPSTPNRSTGKKKPTKKKKKKAFKRSPFLHKLFSSLEKNFSAMTFGIIVALILIAIFLVGVIVGVKIHSSLEEKRDINSYIQKASKEYDVPYDIIHAVIETESSFKPDAVSPTGARGLMQINEITLKEINIQLKTKYTFNDLFDPEINVRLGTFYLSHLYARFGDYETVYAAYNAGPTAVSKWLKDPQYSSDGKTLIHENIPFAETKRYVEKVIAFRENYLASQE